MSDRAIMLMMNKRFNRNIVECKLDDMEEKLKEYG